MKRSLIIAFLCGGVFAAPIFAYASTSIYFETSTSSPVVGVPFSMRMLIDSDQPANAYSIKFNYPPQLFQLLNTSNANSVITIWQDNPTVARSGDVAFSGGSINSFEGRGGELLTVNFVPRVTGTVRLAPHDAYVYLANGKGTKITPVMKALSLVVTNSSGQSYPSATTADVTPPTITFLSLIDDPFNGKQKLLGFQTTDTGSGVGETTMRYRSFIFWSPWQTIKNPVPLGKNIWEVDFRVTDNAGNTTEQLIYDWAAIWLLIVKAVLIIIFLIVILYFLNRRKVVK